jgi:hypothetical protein
VHGRPAPRRQPRALIRRPQSAPCAVARSHQQEVALVADHLESFDLRRSADLGAVHLGSSIAAADDLDRTGFIAWSVSNNTQVIFSGGYTYDARHAS